MFDNLNCRFQTSTDRWFRVTRAVLHRKGIEKNAGKLPLPPRILNVNLNLNYPILKPNFPCLVWLLVLKWVQNIDCKLFLKVNYMTILTQKKTCKLYNDLKSYLINCLGQLDRILIHPGKIMKVYATLKGAIKKYVGN